MATAIMGSPIKKVYGETVSLTTTAAHLGFMPTYHEVMFYCASAWRMGLAPRLARVKYYNASTYTDYTSQAIDRSTTTHVPLDAMTANTHYLYLGFTDPVRGFYVDMGTGVNNNASVLTVEYMYDISGPPPQTYYKITGTGTGALTVGETVTGSVSGCTAKMVYYNSAYIIVKTIAAGSTLLKKGQFTIGEDVAGASQSCGSITAIDAVAPGTGYFTAVASQSDGTESPAGTPFAVDGLISFTLPSVVRGLLKDVDPSESLYWYRFSVATALDTPLDLAQIVPACDAVTYAYMEAGTVYQFALNVIANGAFEFDHTATDTLDVTWIQH